MTVRFFNSGMRASQLREQFAKDWSEPWCSEPVAPPPLARNLEIALLTLRRSDHATQVLQALFAKGDKPATRSDYEALIPLGFADRNIRGYHAITPHGQWRAGNLVRVIASELGITLKTYRPIRRGTTTRLWGMSDSGNG